MLNAVSVQDGNIFFLACKNDGRRQIQNVPHVIQRARCFYPPLCSLWGFLLASACLFCWMPQNTDVSLKYWIQPSRGCELCLLLKEQERERGEERWDLWINCHQFISFTGQSEAWNAGGNWILVVVKHHKSKQRERLKVRNRFGRRGKCRMRKGAGRNWLHRH